MATLQHHRQLLMHGTEVICDSGRGDGAITVRIANDSTQMQQQHYEPLPVAKGVGGGGGSGKVNPTIHKYSISSSCSSADSRPVITSSPKVQTKAPQLFERSAAQCWDPKFDSPVLEEACQERCFPQKQRRFRYVLFYLAVASLLWGVYFGVNSSRCHPVTFLAPTASFLTLLLLLFLFTFTKPYMWLYNQTSLLLIALTFAITLAPQMQTATYDWAAEVNASYISLNKEVPHQMSCISPVGTFSLCMEVLLLVYSVLHIRLYASVMLGLLYSVLFEAFGWLPLLQRSYEATGQVSGLQNMLLWLGPAKGLLHLCAHVIGIHLFIMSEVRSRSTFLKVGQAIMHGRDLEVEKALKERMIHSVMPRRVADELMKQGDDEGGGESSGKRYSSGACSASAVAVGCGGSGGGLQSQSVIGSKNNPHSNHRRKKTSIPRGQIIFRPFNMKRMEPVSILFADIVGFTKMSANKKAPALVGLLNDLFGRFDRLCELTCCEKISTLGDCYYCVAGCPEPREDHAYCCVDMGLGMIQAIEQFCQETCETVNMRVGVHTGTVLCGILGIKRFKFDVWSNDVNLANLMEQLGVAGKVHLSEATAQFLDDRYQREDGQVAERAGQSAIEKLKGMKTYLISGRKLDHDVPCACSQGGEFVGVNVPSCPQPCTPDLIHGAAQATESLLPQKPSDKAVPPCVFHGAARPSMAEQGDDVAVLNGCQEEHKLSSAKFLPGHRAAVNGLLSPPLEDAVRASQSSLCDIPQKENKTSTSTGTGTSIGMAASVAAAGTGMDHSALIRLRAKNFKQKSDAHFVEVIREDSLMKDYFFKPPINKISLNFLERPLEKAYRSSYKVEVKNRVPVQTFASPTFSSFLDVLLSCFVFLALTVACFLPFLVNQSTVGPPALAALILAPLAGLLELASLLFSVRMTFYLKELKRSTRSLALLVSGWVSRHLIGAVLVSLPAVSVLSHVSAHLPLQVTMFLCCATILAIIQYCNFCQLSFWMRSVFATITGLALLLMLYGPVHSSSNNAVPVHGLNYSKAGDGVSESDQDSSRRLFNVLVTEAILAFFLLLLLVWFLNRESEVSYRLHYHGNVEADKHRSKIQMMRDQAEWLLGNIIPIHVADQLKETQSYSKNHDSVGVIFASIVNFSEFYEESYEGGKECYRVLNELIGDFDELLRKPEFRSVEKIKTIGSTYMAASGLNVQQMADDEDESPHAHLRALFNFALDMMGVLDDFNKNMLGFGFKLRIGFNHGPLTAGVIGTTKLLYDIWGDTVNIASRMDSTGVECRVQVSEESHAVLSAMGLEFDYRGTVNVKGKGQMRTFLYPRSGESFCQDRTEQAAGVGPTILFSDKTLATAVPASSSPPNQPPQTQSTVRAQRANPKPEPTNSTEETDEGYRDSAHTPEESPDKDINTLPCSELGPATQASSETEPAPLASREDEEEEEANELTKLNEEFYARL
ncbi:adenylate cyclase type 9-like isoform X1 [Cyprinodon tularosa]|uniref:adenylate cyclase type 9-like isoform X1 n=1 Tax=Cyprinodon tularosa TaxID=77115 RepID=UPI0018E2266D|nr:adenylate cyclase type 9-like isoform X1 [Cyprinodon tularosa]XP_038163289.1 adenylate cyclase type 9-like isoform X1 [Cyprinodon tularosa]XP_038163290.1 adenylate cyclase type 9-like isoform X1 [Cyprinodon tularosa]